MTQNLVAAPVAKKSRFPKSVPFIIGNEAAERFSYYGLRSILVIFLVAQFYNPTGDPALTGIGRSTCQCKHPLFCGAFLLHATFRRHTGRLVFWKIQGNIMAIPWFTVWAICFTSSFTTSLNLFTVGLVLIAIGAGGIKSCVSANVGDQFDKTNQDLLSKVYGWFYFSINAGSMVSLCVDPLGL